MTLRSALTGALLAGTILTSMATAGEVGVVVVGPTEPGRPAAIGCPMLRSYLLAQELLRRHDPDAGVLVDGMGCVDIYRGDSLVQIEVRGDYMHVYKDDAVTLLWTRSGLLCLFPHVPDNVVGTSGDCPVPRGWKMRAGPPDLNDHGAVQAPDPDRPQGNETVMQAKERRAKELVIWQAKCRNHEAMTPWDGKCP